MPELPEVETIVLGLQQNLLNNSILDVEVFNDNTIKHPGSIAQFIKSQLTTKILNVKRRGKYIEIILDNSQHLIIHLRMTGQLLFSLEPMELNHLRVKWVLERGTLYFNDIRKFGTISLLDEDYLHHEKGYWSLGVEPLSESFDLKYLKGKIKGFRPIKNFILDQRVIAGLGNIYADECLFLAGILTKRPINTLTDDELEKLVIAIKDILLKAIENRGTTFSDYKDSYGGKGGFQNLLKVYGRSNDICLICDKTLLKDKLGGRTTVYCPNCQK